MGRRGLGKGPAGPWYGNDAQRAHFERGSRQLVRGRTWGGSRHYTLTLAVPHYAARRVDIVFENGARFPRVIVDGPTDSPHRYAPNELCLWYPDDPREQRWVFDDGLLELIGMVARHLFREAWWRETGEWAGPEAPHSVHRGSEEKQP